MNGTLFTREEELAAVIHGMRTIAVMGLKDGKRPDAPAYGIPPMLAADGYEILGINPTLTEALGRPTLASVGQLDRAVDVLEVFRRSDAIPELTDELLAMPADLRPRTVWLQSGIRHDESAARMTAAGMNVVQDACLGERARRHRART